MPLPCAGRAMRTSFATTTQGPCSVATESCSVGESGFHLLALPSLALGEAKNRLSMASILKLQMIVGQLEEQLATLGDAHQREEAKRARESRELMVRGEFFWKQTERK